NALYGLTGTPYAFVPGVEGSTKFQQVGRISNWKQDTDSWAVFFQGSYDITDELAITAGVRYTEEDKSVHADMDLTTNTTGLATPNAHPLLGALMGASFASYAHNFNEDRSTDAVMPSVNLEWSQSDDNMFYIAYSEGFKSGGFNAVDDQDPAFTAAGVQPTVPGLGFEYDDETSSSFEIGGKHTLLDGAMNLNWALFDSEYKDQQVSTFVGLGFVVTNAASTDVKGLELDLTWQATDNLQLGASVAFMDGQFGSYPGAGCTAAQASGLLGLGTLTTASPVTSYDGCHAQFKGDGTQAGAGQDLVGGQVGTDYNGSVFADYATPVAADILWFTSVDITFTDGYFMNGDLDPIDYQDGFSKTNIRTGLRGDNWDLMLYGKNVFDEVTPSGAFDVPLAAGSHAQYILPGATWGARLSFTF
ncbi:MAG TPA: TonB-dependent receptor, partial [Porticoccaceae bacterium]|nr:TonB-dependent receptor [Porticoccaceae bacterium]